MFSVSDAFPLYLNKVNHIKLIFLKDFKNYIQKFQHKAIQFETMTKLTEKKRNTKTTIQRQISDIQIAKCNKNHKIIYSNTHIFHCKISLNKMDEM